MDARIPASVRDRLAAMGHELVVQEPTPDGNVYGWFGRVNAIRIDFKMGLIHGGSGPAWGTAAAGL
ncbi:hypothetical protein [Rhodospirillaceae bacterium SYSU D60014]|uniref:hypothetical protein n=1 Tax=Virgifigura deserti TaxID=2268457 RepID=UPI000E65F317